MAKERSPEQQRAPLGAETPQPELHEGELMAEGSASEELLSLRHYFQEVRADLQPPPGLLSKIVDDGLEVMAAQRQSVAVSRASQPMEDASRSKWSDWLNWTGWLSGWATAAAAAVFAVMWLPSPTHTGHTPDQTRTTPPPSTRAGVAPVPRKPPAHRPQRRKLVFVGKGAHALTLLHARRTLRGFAHKQTTRHGTKLHSGDLVQLQYQTTRPLYVMMLSLNRKGEVSLFIPYGKSHSAKIEQGKGHLPKHGSLELDDYVGTELFFVLSSSKSFAVEAARSAVKKAYQEAKKASGWTQIRTLPGPWRAQVIAVHKHSARGN